MADLKLSLIIRGVEKGAKSLLKGVKGGVKDLNNENRKAAGVEQLVGRATDQTTHSLRGRIAALQAEMTALRIGNSPRAKRLAQLKQEIDELRQLDDAQKRNAASAARFANGVAKIAGSIVGVTVLLGGLTAAAALIAAPIGLIRFTQGQAKTAAQLGREAAALKVGVGKIQELREAFRMNEQEPEKATDLYKNLQKAQTGAFRGSKEQATAFRAIGLAIKDQNGQLKPVDRLLTEAADGYAKIQHAQKRAYIAQALFGMGVEDLDPILKDGSRGLEAYGLQARRQGLWTEENVRQGKKAREAWLQLTGSLQGLARVAAGELFPILSQVTDRIRVWLENPKNRTKLISAITDAARQLSRALPDLLPKLEGFLDNASKLMTDVDWKGVASGITTIAHAIEAVGKAIDFMNRTGGFAAVGDMVTMRPGHAFAQAAAQGAANVINRGQAGAAGAGGRSHLTVEFRNAPEGTRARARAGSDIDIRSVYRTPVLVR